MNDTAERIYRTITTAVVLIFIALFIWFCHDYGQIVSEVKPQTVKEEVLTYPCRDNSPTLRAAEVKVNKQITAIVQSWNSTCQPNLRDCGAVERVK
jgi:hypothetical protein